MKIKILEFSNQWSLGGTEKTAQLFIENLPKDKYEIYAAGWRGGDRLEFVEKAAKETFINEDPAKMTEWVKSKNIDIVHFHRMGDPDPKLVNTFLNAGVPILVEHNIFAHFDSTVDRTKIAKHIFVSHAQVEIYKQRAGMLFEESKCISIYNPVNTEEFDAYEWNRDTNKKIFGRYSRKHTGKWHPINVECLPYIKKELPEAEFHVIGLPDEYKERIKQLDCMDMVREFPTTLSTTELCDFLNGINVFTHGSIYGESFGISIAEAMASGLPVVTHSGGDSAQAELVTNDFNGYVTDPNDVQKYASRVVGLLRSPAKCEKFGDRGRTRTKEWFDVNLIITQLDELFTRLYKEKA